MKCKRFGRFLLYGILVVLLILIGLSFSQYEFFDVNMAKSAGDSKKQDTPIENVGLGPFDYGLNDNIQISGGAQGSANYMGGQGGEIQRGNFHRNIFSYLKP